MSIQTTEPSMSTPPFFKKIIIIPTQITTEHRMWTFPDNCPKCGSLDIFPVTNDGGSACGCNGCGKLFPGWELVPAANMSCPCCKSDIMLHIIKQPDQLNT